jgi:hypothetical protein
VSQQLSLFDAMPVEAPPLDDLLRQLGQHEWDRVGTPKKKGATTFHTFRRGGTDDVRDLAEGELSYWLADLDRAAGTWAKRARADIGAIEVVITRQGLENRTKAARENVRQITDVELRRKVREELVRAEAIADERIARLEQRAAEQERAARPRAQQASPAPARPNPQHRHTKAEVRAVQSAGEVLRAAGWTRVAGDALGLVWSFPDPDVPTELYEVTFENLAEVEQAAALLRAEPTLTPTALLDRMEPQAETPRLPALPEGWSYGFHRSNTSRTLAHIWRAAPSKSAKVRHETACGMAMQHEAPGELTSTAGVKVCAQCRQHLEATTEEAPRADA